MLLNGTMVHLIGFVLAIKICRTFEHSLLDICRAQAPLLVFTAEKMLHVDMSLKHF